MNESKALKPKKPKKPKYNVEDYTHNYFADFETTSVLNFLVDGEVRVFMWRVEDIYGYAVTGTGVDAFFYHMKTLSKDRTVIVWFHNLKFDLSFIEWALLNKGVAQFKAKMHRSALYTSWGGEYTVTRDGMGHTYGVEWFTGKKSCVKFRDSAKIFPIKLEDIGEMVGEKKLSDTFDYEMYREATYKATPTEWTYLQSDTSILRKAMIQHFKRHPGAIRMTRSSYAFAELREDYNKRNQPADWAEARKEFYDHRKTKITYFEHMFPPTRPELHNLLNLAYAGGIVYVNPLTRDKIVKGGLVYDVNSEYPAAMQQYFFPTGHEIEFEGLYTEQSDEIKDDCPLYVQNFTCSFKLKDGGFPMLPMKYTDGQTSIYNHEQLRGNGMMSLCTPDMQHFFNNYDVWDFTARGGYMWRQVWAPFEHYIQKGAEEKKAAERSGNEFMRFMAKLNINGCYGKMAQTPFTMTRNPYLDENEVLRYRDTVDEPEEKNYFPMAIFIAAYARDILLKGIYAAGVERVLYVDTDSIHLSGTEVPEDLEVHHEDFGKWKLEGTVKFARYLRPKMYAEIIISPKGKRKFDVKGAGLSDEAKAEIKSLKDFTLSREYLGNLRSKMVRGGTLLFKQAMYAKPNGENATAQEILDNLDYLEDKEARKAMNEAQEEYNIDRLKERLVAEGKIR